MTILQLIECNDAAASYSFEHMPLVNVPQCYKSLKRPVTGLRAFEGAGPHASTVIEPAVIWVLPASDTRYVLMPVPRACASILVSCHTQAPSESSAWHHNKHRYTISEVRQGKL